MKKLQLSLLILMIPVLFSCESSTDKVIDIEAEKAAIQNVIDEHMDAIDSLDVNRILAGQTEDHLDMPPNMPRIKGQEAYKEFFTPWIGFFESLKYKEMTFDADEFVVSGDWAFQIGTYSTKFVFQDDNAIEDEGNFVWIFKKETDGNWKWARLISNSTRPLPISE